MELFYEAPTPIGSHGVTSLPSKTKALGKRLIKHLNTGQYM